MIHITSHIFLPFFIILIHAFDVKYFFPCRTDDFLYKTCDHYAMSWYFPRNSREFDSWISRKVLAGLI